MQTINPSTEKAINDWNFFSEFELENALFEGARAHQEWRRVSVDQRFQFLKKLERVLGERLEELARQITLEMGKPIVQARAEIKKSQTLCGYYSDKQHLLDPQFQQVAGFTKSYLSYQPKGVILGIMPWNFPLWQVMRFAVPAILTGNSVLLKHAPNTFGCGEIIGDIFSQVDLPECTFQNIRVDVDQVPTILSDERVHGVSFTGSTRGGMAVAALAGQFMKKSLFELGGSDAYLVLDDADVALAAKKLVTSRMLNNGQSCVAAKRFIVLPKVKADFVEAVVEEMKTYKSSDPMLDDCQQGPMARKDLRDHLDIQVQKSIKQGAKLLLGGGSVKGKGWYYQPTVLSEVTPGQVAFEEELFGPVASIIPAKDESEALEMANASSYGLGGGIFSKDVERAEALVRDHLICGMVMINDFLKSTPALPFGGEKNSGFGRELSEAGLFEFCNLKTVMVGE